MALYTASGGTAAPSVSVGPAAAPKPSPIGTVYNNGQPAGSLYRSDFSNYSQFGAPTNVLNTKSPNLAALLANLNPSGTTTLGWSYDPIGGAGGTAGTGGGGGTSSFMTDPFYQQALSQEHAGISQLDAWLKAQREQAIIRFGDPALASLAGFGLDPQAATFARQNYLSGNADLARLDKQNTLNKQSVINKLAARGLLRSGDLGYQEGQADQAYGNSVYDARNKVLDYLSNLNQTYLDRRNTLQQAVMAAAQQAYQNQLYALLNNQGG